MVKKNNNPPPPKKQRTKRVQKPQLTRTPQLDLMALKHAHMLYDPCNSDLSESTYPGDRGYVNRFTANNGTPTLAGHTGFVLIFKPGNALGHISSFTDPAANITIAFGNGNYPGNAFYSTNCAKQRAVAFCVSLQHLASATNVSGFIDFGVISAAQLPNAAVMSPNQIAGLLTNKVTAMSTLTQTLEVKWCPGSFDDRYCPQGVTDDDSDRNVVVIVGRNLAASVGTGFKVTAITEWAPKVGLEVALDATSVKESECDKDCVIKYLNSRDKDWWWELGAKTLKFATRALKGYARGGFLGAAASFV